MLNRCTRPLVIAGMLASLATSLRAQSSRFVVDRWTTDNGLPQNTVHAIAQTPDGYLWLGTYGGLIRFDGVRFVPFPAREFPAIPSDRDQALAVDSTGALWVGTDNGVVRYRNGRFERLTMADDVSGKAITALSVDSRGAVWIGTQGDGITRYANGRFTRFGRDEGLERLSTGRAVEDASGRIWVQNSGRPALYDPAAERFISDPPTLPAPDLKGPWIKDRNGGLWFEQRGGVARWDGKRLLRISPFTAHAPGYGWGIAEGTRGEFWVTTNGRIWRVLLDRPTPVIEPMALSKAEATIHDIFVDREGVRWLGTDVKGLLRLRPRLFQMIGQREGLSGPHPMAILGDRTGRVWIGSNCGGTLDIFDRGTVTPFRSASNERIGCAWSLARGADGAMWVGTWGGGVVRVDGGRLRWYTRREGLTDQAIMTIHVDADGTAWFGSLDGGLFRLSHDRITSLTTRDGLPGNGIRVIQRDAQGTLWVGTTAGLGRLRGDRFESFRQADGLGVDHVRAIHQDAEGVLWFGTYGGGLTRFKDGRFTTITREHGLADDVVSAILEDDAGYLWMSGNRGISRVARLALNDFAEGRSPAVHSVLFGKPDGLDPVETNGGFTPAAWKAPDGRLWFPTIEGIAIVDPAQVAINPVPPRVLIEELRVDGHPHSLTDSLRFAPGAGQFAITYTGLSSPAPASVSFRYRLEGADRAWVDAGTRRTAYYSGLRPGRYTFTVDAANRDGLWNTQGASLAFELLPPFWLTWWFRTATVLLILAGGAGAAQSRVRRLRAAHAAQQEFSRRLLAAQERERQRLAGELHDGIGQDLLVAKNHLTLALQREQLTDSARQQLEQASAIMSDSLRGAREMAHNLRPYLLDHLGLAATIRAAVTRAGQSSGIQFDAQVDELDHLFQPDAQVNVFRIVQEGINNVLKHSGCTEATVSVRGLPAEVQIVLHDNGRGMSDLAAARRGFGLSGVAERVGLLGGQYTIESAEGEGTTLSIRIPVHGPR